MKKFPFALCLAFLAALALLGPINGLAFFNGKNLVPLTANGNEVRVPGTKISDKASFYSVQAEREGKKVSVVFFLVRGQQNNVHAALDACDACWAEGKGYTQDGDFFICNNCNMRFNVSRIGMRKGGCNPHPLSFKEENGNIVLRLDELEAGAVYFPK